MIDSKLMRDRKAFWVNFAIKYGFLIVMGVLFIFFGLTVPCLLESR